jgi:UDP-2,3-diacylglucosamine pyrophosphatase LpxH
LRTLVVSDLHLGSRTDADVLRREEARAALVAGLEGVDRLVLLGDVLELRHGPMAEALDAARPALEAIGGAMAGGEIVITAGNHDHALVAPWLERRALARAGPLALEERLAPAEASDLAAAVASVLEAASVSVAYPGVWLRGDVYATHGHYLDVHVTVPTFERLGVGLTRRVTGSHEPETPDDYEAVLAPLYGWLHVVARHTRTGFGAERQRGTQNAWRLLTSSERRPLRARALVAAFPVAIAAINRAGLGPVDARLSPQELRRAALRAMRAVTRRLGVDARWVLFGHTHRAGPFDRDDGAEWGAGTSLRLINTGSWVHEEVFLGRSPRTSPYWPGGAVIVDDDGSPPRRVNLLPDFEP